MSPKGQPIDVDALHRYLHRKSDRLGRLKIVQRELAETLGITHFAVNRILGRMEEQGRLGKLASDQKNIWTYVINDPEED